MGAVDADDRRAVRRQTEMIPSPVSQEIIPSVSAWVGHTVTLRWCYYSTTAIWDKLLSDPESSHEELSESGEFA